MRNSTTIIKGIAFSIITVFANTSYANFIGNDFQLFNPATSSSKYISVEDAQPRKFTDFNLGIFLDYATNTYSVQEPTRAEKQPTFREGSESLVSGYLNLSFNLLDNVEFNFGMPFAISSSVDYPKDKVILNIQGITDLRLGFKYVYELNEMIRVAALALVNFNQIVSNPYIGDNKTPHYTGMVVTDLVFSEMFDMSINIGYRYRGIGAETIDNFLTTPLGPQVIYSLAFGSTFASAKSRVFLEILGAQDTKHENKFLNRVENAVETRLGYQFFDGNNFRFMFALGTELTHGIGTSDLRLIAGVDLLNEVDNRYNKYLASNAVRDGPKDEFEADQDDEQKEDVNKLETVLIAFKPYSHTKLRRGSTAKLQKILDIINADGETKYLVELLSTYSDRSRSKSKAIAIGEKRSNMVKKYLTKKINDIDLVEFKEQNNVFKEQEILTRTSQIGIVLRKVAP